MKTDERERDFKIFSYGLTTLTDSKYIFFCLKAVSIPDEVRLWEKICKFCWISSKENKMRNDYHFSSLPLLLKKHERLLYRQGKCHVFVTFYDITKCSVDKATFWWQIFNKKLWLKNANEFRNQILNRWVHGWLYIFNLFYLFILLPSECSYLQSIR